MQPMAVGLPVESKMEEEDGENGETVSGGVPTAPVAPIVRVSPQPVHLQIFWASSWGRTNLCGRSSLKKEGWQGGLESGDLEPPTRVESLATKGRSEQ